MSAHVQLSDPIERLNGVGPALKSRLERLHIGIVRDLLFHLPNRYQDRTRLTAISRLVPQTDAVIEGIVENSHVQFGRRRSLAVKLGDETGSIHLRFFHFSQSQQKRFAAGRLIRCFGEVRRGAKSLEMVHPECHILDPEDPSPLENTLTPIYPVTEGLQQGRLRKLIVQGVTALERTDEMTDLLPPKLVTALELPTLSRALVLLHRPPADVDLEKIMCGMHPAQKRLAFEELLAHQLSLKLARQKTRKTNAPKLARSNSLHSKLIKALGFQLTNAQIRVVDEIEHDLNKNIPMLRLLQGDVGSGKTAVAALAALPALAQAYQVCLMAPTDLLAEQHWRNFQQWYGELGIPVTRLTGRLSAKQKRQAREEIAAGGARLIIGTHALFQESVEYPKLGFLIVDEQHRFGVDQRLALRDKASAQNISAHQLIMTATPIPRTLAMTAYADLDVSVIDELPPSRTPVNTVAIADTRRDDVVDRIGTACAEGRQAYWVCPLIDESDLLEAQAATDTLAYLQAKLPELSIGLIHGRLSDQEKEDVMGKFSSRRLNLLVATTVIEVGVDVPNASLMVIDNAERLGLSQLHQLRGRVGRGAARSDCLLIYKAPLGEIARSRLECIRETTDGFVIAERDLELRGPGEVLGTRQTGVSDFRIADLARDRDLLPIITETADTMLANDSNIAEQIIKRWLSDRIEYGNV